jgi:hypothetical protein
MTIDYIASQVGDRVDGIFGSNLFLHYIIAIDYEQQRVTFHSLRDRNTSSGLRHSYRDLK